MMIFNNAKRFRLINKNIIYSISNNISSFVSNNSNSTSSNLISTYYRHKSLYYCITQRCLSSYEPVSRKKGKKNDGSDYVFEEVAKIALVSIKDAIEPLLALNPTYVLKAEDTRVVLATGNKGTYSFEINSERETLRVLSPGSGSFSYFYNYEDKTWLNIKDNHDMRGLITRDLLRHCTGLPLFK